MTLLRKTEKHKAVVFTTVSPVCLPAGRWCGCAGSQGSRCPWERGLHSHVWRFPAGSGPHSPVAGQTVDLAFSL